MRNIQTNRLRLVPTESKNKSRDSHDSFEVINSNLSYPALRLSR